MTFWQGFVVGMFAPGLVLAVALWFVWRYALHRAMLYWQRWADRRDMIWTTDLGDDPCPDCGGWRAIGHRAGCGVALGLRRMESSLGERKVQG